MQFRKSSFVGISFPGIRWLVYMYFFSKWFYQNSGWSCKANLLQGKKLFEIGQALLHVFAGRESQAALAFPVFTLFGVSFSLTSLLFYHLNGVVKISRSSCWTTKTVMVCFHSERTSWGFIVLYCLDISLAEEKNFGIYCFRSALCLINFIWVTPISVV